MVGSISYFLLNEPVSSYLYLEKSLFCGQFPAFNTDVIYYYHGRLCFGFYLNRVKDGRKNACTIYIISVVLSYLILVIKVTPEQGGGG